jgi:hypothetical protein
MDSVRIVGSIAQAQGSSVREVEEHQVVGSRGATWAATNPVPTEYDACQAKTKAGQPCKSPNVKGEPLCLAHRRQREADR